MKQHKISRQVLDNEYDGSGYVLAAVTGDEVVKMIYMQDIVSDKLWEKIESAEGEHAKFVMGQWLKTADAAPHVRELQALGEVVVGMASCGWLVEL